MEQEHPVHKRIVVVAGSVKYLVSEVTVETFVVMNGATTEIVKPHRKRNEYQRNVSRQFELKRYNEAGLRTRRCHSAKLNRR